MTRIQIAVALLLSGCLAPLAFAKSYINGQVVLVDKNDDQIPAVGVDVVVLETGDSDTTKANGQFRIFLPDIIKPGEKVTIQVTKRDWKIWKPEEGQMRVPAPSERGVDIIRLLRK